jgi:hypothetical protein
MGSHLSENQDTTETRRKPVDLLDYLVNGSLDEELVTLLARHRERLPALLEGGSQGQAIEDALFIIELNGFSKVLLEVARLSDELHLEWRRHHENLEKLHDALRGFDAEELANQMGRFYLEARRYDRYFEIARWQLRFKGRPVFLPFFPCPFSFDPSVPNADNLCNLVAAHRVHERFFQTYLNVLYADGVEGERFLGRSFGDVAAEHRAICEVVAEVADLLPDAALDGVIEGIEQKRQALEALLKGHPATLHKAMTTLVSSLEDPHEVRDDVALDSK